MVSPPKFSFPPRYHNLLDMYLTKINRITQCQVHVLGLHSHTPIGIV